MSYSAYPAYSPSVSATGLAFPSIWFIERLRFSVLSNPVRSEVAHWDDGTAVSFVPMDAVGEQGEIDPSQEKQLADVYNGYTYFLENDILIAKITPCFENGKGAIARGLKSGVGFGTTEFHVLRPLQGMSERWLFYLTKCDFFRKIGGSEMLGAGGQKRLPEEFIRNLRVGIPSFSEQERIANFLDWKTGQIDALIAKKQVLIEKLKEKRLAVITQAVTKGLDASASLRDSHIPWLGEVPTHWDVIPIKFSLLNPITDGPHETPQLLTDGVPFISAEAVKNDELDFVRKRGYISREDHEKYAKKYRPLRGDIYMVKSGATTGNVARVDTDEEFNIWSPLAALRPEPTWVTTDFIFYFMKSKPFFYSVELAWSYGTQQNIGMSVIENLKMACPPVEEQIRITKHIEIQTKSIDAMLTKCTEAIARLTEYRTALITAATTGQIDVRGWQAGKEGA